MKRLKPQWIASLAALGVVVYIFGRFLLFVEGRPGAILDDPLLRVLPAADLAIPIFSLIYGLLISAAFILWRSPDVIFHAMRAYTLLTLLRMTAMYLTPLDPPAGMVVLRDPFVESIMGGQVFTRDLFFSGHTSSLFLISLNMPDRKFRAAFFIGTAAVAVMLLIQHTHYSIDVFAAPFFSLFANRAAARIKFSN